MNYFKSLKVRHVGQLSILGVEHSVKMGDLPPWFAAARDGSLDLIQQMAAAGQDVNEAFQGHTATDIANANGHFEIMKWIQQHKGGGSSHGAAGDCTSCRQSQSS